MSRAFAPRTGRSCRATALRAGVSMAALVSKGLTAVCLATNRAGITITGLP